MSLKRTELKLRVYRRTLDTIVLLWSKNYLNDDQRKNVLIFVKEDDASLKKVKFKVIDEVPTKDKKFIADDTVVAGISVLENNLDPYKKYTFVVVLGEGDTIELDIEVLAYGVLPNTEKDKKDAHSQLFGWDANLNTWVKIPVVKTKNGTYAIPMVVIKEE